MPLRGPALHIVCIQHQAGSPRTRRWAHGWGIRKALYTQRGMISDREADVNNASLHHIALQVERCVRPRHEMVRRSRSSRHVWLHRIGREAGLQRCSPLSRIKCGQKFSITLSCKRCGCGAEAAEGGSASLPSTACSMAAKQSTYEHPCRVRGVECV